MEVLANCIITLYVEVRRVEERDAFHFKVMTQLYDEKHRTEFINSLELSHPPLVSQAVDCSLPSELDIVRIEKSEDRAVVLEKVVLLSVAWPQFNLLGGRDNPVYLDCDVVYVVEHVIQREEVIPFRKENSPVLLT